MPGAKPRRRAFGGRRGDADAVGVIIENGEEADLHHLVAATAQGKERPRLEEPEYGPQAHHDENQAPQLALGARVEAERMPIGLTERRQAEGAFGGGGGGWARHSRALYPAIPGKIVKKTAGRPAQGCAPPPLCYAAKSLAWSSMAAAASAQTLAAMTSSS